MEVEIVWTKQAKLSYDKIIDYLLENWNYNITDDFSSRVYEILSLLETQPFMGHKTSDDDYLRKVLITDKNYLYYEIQNDIIFLLNFQDTRQEPK